MRLPLRYGKCGIQVTLPPDSRVTIIEKPSVPVLSNPANTIQSALDSGVDSPSLKEIATQCRTACVLVCDITRPVPNEVLLPPVIATLLASGIAHNDILLLVATGLHRPNEGDELQTILGSDPILNSIPVANHFARSEQSHVDLGFTNRRTPGEIRSEICGSRFKTGRRIGGTPLHGGFFWW